MTQDLEKWLIDTSVEAGAHAAAIMNVADIPFNRDFRAACESNTCGKFGKCWMCPPDVGDIDELITKARGYRRALVYQTITKLEDSFDIEGMIEGGVRHNELAQKLAVELKPRLPADTVQLGAGNCCVCERCAKLDDQPCRYPDRAIGSMEASGIPVSEIATLCGLKYINGQNTVTYFGAFLYT